MHRRVILPTLLLLVFLSGCSSKDAAARNVLSWTATSLLIAQAWTRGEVPAHYAEHTLDIARQALDEARAAPHAARALALITRAQDAVRAHDAGAARATLAQLEAVAHLQ